jgi:hypothetical protein
MSSETSSSAEKVKTAFSLSKRDKEACAKIVREKLPDIEDSEIAAFGVWCEGNKSAMATFSANEAAWSAYEKISRTLKSFSAFKAYAAIGGNNPDVDTALAYIRKGAAPAKQEKTKEQRTEENRIKREAEEAQRLIDEENARNAQLAQEALQRRQTRATAMQPYQTITMSDAIANAAWQVAINSYIDAGTGNYGMANSYANNLLVAALGSWRGYRNQIVNLGGVITGISTFTEPQDKAEEGKSNVGATLATRTVQANFILYIGQSNVNVHIDQT